MPAQQESTCTHSDRENSRLLRDRSEDSRVARVRRRLGRETVHQNRGLGPLAPREGVGGAALFRSLPGGGESAIRAEQRRLRYRVLDPMYVRDRTAG